MHASSLTLPLLTRFGLAIGDGLLVHFKEKIGEISVSKTIQLYCFDAIMVGISVSKTIQLYCFDAIMVGISVSKTIQLYCFDAIMVIISSSKQTSTGARPGCY